MGRALGTGHRVASALPVIQDPSCSSLLAYFSKFVPKLEGGRELGAARPGAGQGVQRPSPAEAGSFMALPPQPGLMNGVWERLALLCLSQ